jgi:type II secretory pathway component PulL
MRSHEWIDQRSLALHEAVAAKLEAQPALIRVARANLERWLRGTETAALLEWRRLLDVLSMPDLLALLCSPGEDAARLRQSSPFAGVLSPRERQAILDRHDPRGA